MRCNIPFEYVPSRRLRALLSPTRSSNSFTRFLSFAPRSPQRCPKKCSVSSPVRNFWKYGFSGRKPTASRLSTRRLSRPKISVRPRVGDTRPRIIFNVVLLPEPFGPSNPYTSPGSMRRLRSFTARTPRVGWKGTGKILVSPWTATAGRASAQLPCGELVMANLKAAGRDRFVQLILGLFANERVKFALSDAIEKGAYLLLITCNPKFYATVRQVAHPTGHVKAFGDVAHGETEPDALNVTFIKDLKRDHHR